MNNSKEFLGTEPIGKLLFKLAVPSVIAQIVNMLYNIVDRMYVARIANSGMDALAALGIVLPITLIMQVFANLVGLGGAPQLFDAGFLLGRRQLRRQCGTPLRKPCPGRLDPSGFAFEKFHRPPRGNPVRE